MTGQFPFRGQLSSCLISIVYDRETAMTTVVSPVREITEPLNYPFQAGISADGSVVIYTILGKGLQS